MTGTQAEDGETRALDIDTLYREHAPFLGRVIRRLVGDGPHVDDLLQETFVTAFKKRKEFEGRSAPRTWLYAIASHLCSRHRRSLRRFLLFQDRLAQEDRFPLAIPEEQVARAQLGVLVHGVLQRLPFEQREVFVLYEVEVLEGREIAAMIGRPIGTVWTRLHHARKEFERLMSKKLGKERGL